MQIIYDEATRETRRVSPGVEARREERDAAIDVARGIAILLVIYAHGLQVFFGARPDGAFSDAAFAQWRVIYSFHMPLFFLISGMTAQNLPRKSWRRIFEQALFLVALAYASHVAGVALAAALGRIPADSGAIFRTLVRPMLIGKDFSLVTTWFLVALAGAQILAAAIVKGPAAPRCAAIALAAALVLADPFLPNPFQIRSFAPGLLFYLAGYTLARVRAAPPAVVAPALLAAVVVLAPLNNACLAEWSCAPLKGFYADFLAGRFGVLMITGDVGFFPLFALTALLGSLLVVIVGRAIASGPLASSLARPLAWSGRNALDLVLVNGVFIVFLQPVLQRLPPSDDALAHVGLGAAIVALNLMFMIILSPPLRRLVQFSRFCAARAVGAPSKE
ncbi:acyltransferase family protein [Methylocella sp.]|uniref:acyltransferase family protein n=1 Tax=Methylocella sp. TaxID=1978226 RepID=UPI0037842E4F